MNDQRTGAEPDTQGWTAPPSSSAVRSRGRGPGSVALVVALCVAVGGLAFAAGRFTAPQASRAAGFGGFGGAGRGFGGGANGGAPNASGAPFGFGGGLRSLVLEGTVTAVADGRLTLQLASGATVEVELGSDTAVHRQTPASTADLATGSSVLVQLSGPGGFGQGGPNASPAPSGARQLGPAADITILSR